MKPRPATDLNWLRRLLAGDEAAWEDFVQDYLPIERNYAHGLLKAWGLSSPAIHADDIGQEVAGKMLKAIRDKKYDLTKRKSDLGAFRMYLRRTTYRTACDVWRKVAASNGTSETQISTPKRQTGYLFLAGTKFHYDDESLIREVFELARTRIVLDEREQQVIKLTGWEDRDHKNAWILCSPSAVSSCRVAAHMLGITYDYLRQIRTRVTAKLREEVREILSRR
jgi:DNA-directed RNA polymerase specialized sigma24 family protein